MSLEHSSSPDPALRSALRAWQVAEPLPPRFGERVWQRIERQAAPAPGSLWRRLRERLGTALLRPTVAAMYVSVLLAGGLAAGYWHAHLDNARSAQELGTRYVQMLDPLQPTRP